MAGLFDPIALGAIEAPNRILMAPLTRGRAGPDGNDGRALGLGGGEWCESCEIRRSELTSASH